MLMTKYTFYIHEDDEGYCHTAVCRLSDGAIKYFFQCTPPGAPPALTRFMNSITDELAESYFPKPGKKGVEVPADNWTFAVGKFNLDRKCAEAIAGVYRHIELEVQAVYKEMGWKRNGT